MDSKKPIADPIDAPARPPSISATLWRILRAGDGGANNPRLLRVLGGVVLILFVLVGALNQLARTTEFGALWVRVTAEFGLYLCGGIACSGLLIGIGALLRAIRELRDSMVRLERYQYEIREDDRSSALTVDPALHADATPADTQRPAPWAEILLYLEEIRDNGLLADDERADKRRHVADEQIRSAADLVTDLIARNEFNQARELADRLAHKHADDERPAALIQRIEQVREKFEVRDISDVTKQVEDLISISAWGRARDLADQLRRRHPDAVEARQLMLRIEREQSLFEADQRRRMHAEVQRFVSRRRWEEALAAARTFIDRFPGTPEAEGLSMEVPTLSANAEIENRQRLESQIMEYARGGRYLDAVDLARKVIDRYPDSPQAEALRVQLPRLEELAENPKAPPARVRLDN